MYEELRNLLSQAEGKPEFTVVVYTDIRNFTGFCTTADPSEVALFLRKVYIRMMDVYFPDASFAKLTGDGILVVFPYEEKNARDIVNTVVSRCLSLHRDFGSFCGKGTILITPPPQKIGIGASLGPVHKFFSQGVTVDYSGRVLNLAARLTDMARPSGVVLDANFGKLLKPELMVQFRNENVYVRGIAESTPIRIYCSDSVVIDPIYRRRLDKPEWAIEEKEFTLRQIKKMAPRFQFGLESEPVDLSQVRATASIPGEEIGGTELKEYEFTLNLGHPPEAPRIAGQPAVFIEFDELASALEKRKISEDSKVTIEVSYPVR